MSIGIIKKRPHIESTTGVIDAGTSGTVSLIPSKPVFIKSLNITVGANTTINSITINGVNIPINNPPNYDLVQMFGDVMFIDNITVNATNSGTANENLTIEIYGYYLE